MQNRLVVVDSFFEDPDDIRKFALAQKYYPSETGQWPGVRTSPLHAVNLAFNKYFVERLTKYIIGIHDQVKSIDIQAQFQIIRPLHDDPDSPLNRGMVHTDSIYSVEEGVLTPNVAGVVYLTPGAHPRCGTSLFDAVPGVENPSLPFYIKSSLYKTGTVVPAYDTEIKKHFDSFTETARACNKYNRLVAFDSAQWHSCNNFHTGISYPRLTLVFFAELKY